MVCLEWILRRAYSPADVTPGVGSEDALGLLLVLTSIGVGSLPSW